MRAIPSEFWRTVKLDEFVEIVLNDGLNTAQCARLWRIAGYDGEPPNSMSVVFRREDVMRLLHRRIRHNTEREAKAKTH